MSVLTKNKKKFSYSIATPNNIYTGVISGGSENEAYDKIVKKYNVEKRYINLIPFDESHSDSEIGYFHYKLYDTNMQENIEGVLQAASEQEAKVILEKEYNFSSRSFGLEKLMSLPASASHNIHNILSTSKVPLNELQTAMTKEAGKTSFWSGLTKSLFGSDALEKSENTSQNTSQTYYEEKLSQRKNESFFDVEDPADRLKSKQLPGFMASNRKEMHISKEMNVDYRNILLFEKKLEAHKKKLRSAQLKKASEYLEKKIEKLSLSLEGIQLKIAQKEFNQKNQENLNALAKEIRDFEKNIKTVEELFQKKYGYYPNDLKKLVHDALTLRAQLDSTKEGKIPPHVREKASLLLEEKYKAEAQKVLKGLLIIKKRIYELEKDIHFLRIKKEDETELKEKEKIERELHDIEKKWHMYAIKKNEFEHHFLIVKYHPEYANPDFVNEFRSLDSDEAQIRFVEAWKKNYEYNKKTKFKLNYALAKEDKPKEEKHFLKMSFAEMKKQFFDNGISGFFSALKHHILDRKKVDIHEQEKNDFDTVNLTPEQIKMRSKFKFRLDDAEIQKERKEKEKKLSDPVETGNFFKDIYHFLDDFVTDINPISVKELSQFYRLLAVTVSAGFPLIKALRQLVEQIHNIKLKKALFKMAKSIEQGAALADAMKFFPDIFDNATIGMVKSGEMSGMLPQTLKRVADMSEERSALQKKLRGAMMYPLIVLTVLVGVVTALLTFVFPKLMPMFENSETPLPATTKLLLSVSNFLQHQWYIGLFAVVALVLVFKFLVSTYEGRFYWHYVKIRIPILGKLVKMTSLAIFARNLHAFTLSGLPIIKSLIINAESIPNEIYKVQVLGIAENVKQGVSIADSLEGNKLFPPLLVNMIRTGEETATLGEVTSRIAGFYEEETKDMIKNMSTILEPVIILILAVVVGFIMISIMTPLLKITETAI